MVEPGRRSVETAQHVRQLANDLGLTKVAVVGNKIRNDKDKEFLLKQLPGFIFLGFLPYNNEIIEADLEGKAPFEKDTVLYHQAGQFVDQLLQSAGGGK